MRHLSEFVSVNPDLFRPGQLLGANLHIFMPLNKNIVFFRRAGEVLSEEDHAKLLALPKNTLLVHRSERETAFQPLAKNLAQNLSAGKLASAEVRQGAAQILQSLDPMKALVSDGQAQTGEVAKQLLSEVPKLVETVIGGLGDTPSVRAYEAVLKNARNSGENPVLSHNQQVSAIAVLIRLTAGPNPLTGDKGNTNEDIASIGAAGLMHDLGLLSAPRDLVMRHMVGEDEFTVSEKIAYMKHIESSKEALKKHKTDVTEETLITIDQHHENYDGSGFRAVEGKFISYHARILRIADEIVACINHPANTFGFREALGHLVFRERQNKTVTYDPAIMNALAELR